MRITARWGLAYGDDPEQIKIDNDLSWRIANDDEDAFNAFVDRWHGYVSARVRRRIPNRADADEVVNDIFADVWKTRHRDRHTDYVRFFYGIIRIAILKHFRTQRKRHREVALVEWDQLPEDAEDREWNEQHQEAREHLDEALEKLPLKRLSILLDVVVFGRSVRSVAPSHQTSTYFVRKAVNESLAMLREELEPYVE